MGALERWKRYQKAQQKGREAYRAGLSLDDNPYKRSEWGAGSWWDSGWREAKSRYSQNRMAGEARMPDITINVEVWCSCGNGICNNVTVKHDDRGHRDYFVVTPCESCLEKARDDGYKKGFAAGYEKGGGDASEGQD